MAPDGGTNAAIADLFTTHALDLLRLEASERREVRRFLTDLEAEIAATIAKVDPTGPARQSYRVRRLEKLLEQVRDTIRASYRGTARFLAGELAELADVEVDFVTRALNNGIGFDMASASITRETARSLVAGVLVQGAPVADWWSRQAGDTFERFQDAMRQGIAQGETNAQLIRRVRGGRQNGEQIVGFMDVTRRNAESLVRSATQAVSERARQEAYEQNADILSAVVWTSTLDARTTVLCMVRDGLRYEPVTNKPIGHDVPWLSGPGNLHWGCRSASRPETKSWRELGFDIDDLPPGTRASMDGQVAADTTFEAWLSRQSKAAQDAALGTGRADLWRGGTITFRQLLDANGRELTLNELRARTVKMRPAIFDNDNDAIIRERLVRSGRKSGTEFLEAYGQDGRTFSFSGSESSVDISPEMERALKETPMVVHHNHPSSRSFSPRDHLTVGRFRGMKTLYAHGHDGSIFRADRVSTFGQREIDEANNAAARLFIDRERDFSSPADRANLFHHVMSEALAASGKIRYRAEFSGAMLETFNRNATLMGEILDAIRRR